MILKQYKSKFGVVNIHDDFIPKNSNDLKKNLKETYDCINMIFSNSNYNSLNFNTLFYTDEEINDFEKNKKYIFI